MGLVRPRHIGNEDYEGEWHVFEAEGEKADFLLHPLTSVDLGVINEKAMRRIAMGKGRFRRELNHDVYCKLLAEKAIKGWGKDFGVLGENEDGTTFEIPYSKEEAHAMIRDWPRFKIWVERITTDIAIDTEEGEEESVTD